MELIDKRYEELTLTDNFMFMKVMTTYPELTRELLSRIFGKPVSQIVFTEGEKTVELAPKTHGIRMDVYLDDETGTVYDVEMEKTDKPHWKALLPKRSRYYQSVIDVNSLQKGHPYIALRESFVIFICLKDPFGFNRGIYTFRNICEEEPKLSLGDGTAKVFINTSGTEGDISPELKNVFDYLNTGIVRDEYTDELNRAVYDARIHEEWGIEYMSLYFEMMDERIYAREEGLNEGRAQGLTEGRAQGRAEGRDKALIAQAIRKYLKGKTAEDAADELETPVSEITPIYEAIKTAGQDIDAVYECLAASSASPSAKE